MEDTCAVDLLESKMMENQSNSQRTTMLRDPLHIDETRYRNENDGEEQQQYPQEGEVYLMDVYKFKQRYGYCSIIFSIIQTCILIAMLVQCGVAPIRINPMIGPYPDALSYWGAKNAVNIVDDGEIWRLLSPILLHAGVFHLVGNVGVQLETGVFFEREWGSPVWLAIYVTSALGSSILSTCFMPDRISVGSSGAVMGLFGAKLSEIFCRACESRISVQQKVGHAVRKQQLWGTLGGVAIVMLMSFIPFVDWAAHLGGLLAGIAVGVIVFAFSIEAVVWRIFWVLIGHVLALTYFIVTLKYMYNDVDPVEELRDVCK